MSTDLDRAVRVMHQRHQSDLIGLRAENEQLKQTLHRIIGAAAYGPPNADTLKTIRDYARMALKNI
jgi:hypothetical protein